MLHDSTAVRMEAVEDEAQTGLLGCEDQRSYLCIAIAFIFEPMDGR